MRDEGKITLLSAETVLSENYSKKKNDCKVI
jgi:hypothetical protein